MIQRRMVLLFYRIAKIEIDISIYNRIEYYSLLYCILYGSILQFF